MWVATCILLFWSDLKTSEITSRNVSFCAITLARTWKWKGRAPLSAWSNYFVTTNWLLIFPFSCFVFSIIANSSTSTITSFSLSSSTLLHLLPIPFPPLSCLLRLENETFGQVVLAVGYHTPLGHVHDECPYVSEPYIDVFTGYFRMLKAFKYSVSEGR